MPVTKLKNGQLPDTISSKTVDNTNDINTTTTRLKISGGSNGQVLSTDGASNISWITAGGGGGYAPTAILTKLTNESVTNSTTLQDDDHLFYTLTTGKSYWFELFLLVKQSIFATNQQLRVGIAGNSSGSFALPTSNSSVLCNGVTAGFSPWMLSSSGEPVPGIIWGTIFASDTITLKFRFAQLTANSNAVTVMKGSRLLIWEVA